MMVLYRIAEGGPFDLQIGGVTIENITDELVNAKVLVPDTRLQAIADAYSDTSKIIIRGMWPTLADAIEDVGEEL